MYFIGDKVLAHVTGRGRVEAEVIAHTDVLHDQRAVSNYKVVFKKPFGFKETAWVDIYDIKGHIIERKD